MKYVEFVEQVNKYYYTKEPIYFKAIADLEELRKDLSKLDETQHLIGIVKPFLVKWGRMGRVVARAVSYSPKKRSLPIVNYNLSSPSGSQYLK